MTELGERELWHKKKSREMRVGLRSHWKGGTILGKIATEEGK